MKQKHHSTAGIAARRRAYLKKRKQVQRQKRFLKKPMADWSTQKLLVLGAASFVVSAFFLAMLGDVVPALIKESNRVALRDWWPLGFLLWFFVAAIAIGLIYPFAICAQKCHAEIIRRFLG